MSGKLGEGESLSFRAPGMAPDMFCAVTGAFAWAAIIYLIYVKVAPAVSSGGINIPLPAAVGTGALGVMLNVAALARQIYGKKVVFDGASRTVTISRLFGRPSVMSFGSIARAAPLVYKGVFVTRAAYCLVPAIAPLFGAKIISPVRAAESETLTRFKDDTLPKIERMLRSDESARERSEDAPLNAPLCYTTRKARYTKSFASEYPHPVSLLAVFVIFGVLSPLIAAGEIPASGVAALMSITTLMMGAPCLLLLFVSITAISFDTVKQEIELRRGIFGWGGVKTYSMSLARAFEVKAAGNGLDGGKRRSVCLRLNGIRKPIPLMFMAPRGKASADELKFLSRLLGLDPARDMDYTLCHIASTMFEVP